jgi:hypothetical protein
MNELAIKIDSRIFVIEAFVSILFAALCVQQAYPGFDPAMSDLISGDIGARDGRSEAEREDALSRLGAMVRQSISASSSR